MENLMAGTPEGFGNSLFEVVEKIAADPTDKVAEAVKIEMNVRGQAAIDACVEATKDLTEPLSETFPLTTEVFKNAMAQTIETAKSVRKAFNDPETLGNLNTQLAEKGEQIDLQAVDSAIAAMEAEFADEQEENLTGEEVEVQTDLMTFQMVVALKEELDAVKAQLADLENRIVQHNVRASHKL
jgi:hypothetical protein